MDIDNLELLKNRFEEKTWSETISYDTWEIFKVMSEMVEGFEKLTRIGPCVSIFGSARTLDNHRYYKLTEEIAYLLTKSGFGIITGGGHGIMEAANKGAHFAGGKSVGLNIALPFEQKPNPFIDSNKLLTFDYFFRKEDDVHEVFDGVYLFTGWIRNLDEFTEAITLIQTKKLAPFPIILVVKAYWEGFVAWVKEVLLEAKNISKEDLDLFILVDTAEEAVLAINDFYRKYALKPNF